MRTCSQSRNLNLPQQQVPPTFVEPFDLEEPINNTIENQNQNQNNQAPPVVTMADQRTMAELLRAPTEGYAEAIVVPPILAEHFELKHSLINMMTSDQFFGHEKANPHNHIPQCKALADLGASINLMLLSVWKKLGLPELISTRITLELANRAICTPARIARDVFVPVGKFTFPADFVIVDYESDPRVPLILGRPFLRTARALIDVHEEEMILRDGDERLILNMRHDTSNYSNQPHKESINMIDFCNVSYEDYLEDLFATNHLTYLVSDSFPPGSDDTDFDPEGDLHLIEELLNNDPSSPLPLSHNPLSGSTTSSSPDHLLEEFADELALITFPPRNDDFPFDIESDLREIEYLLNHDPTKETDSILEDSVDEDDVDDDLVELESDNDDVYDDPFDSKEDKIKEFKLLINELDPPRSSYFLPSPEYDSVLYEDFSEVDALPSTNNENKF
ncbi:reverse transcriptase domain-containing protein [Tanacetum coccineum]